MAVAGVGVGAALTILISNLTTMPDFATFIGALIGIGVGIDYALLIVTRYREGLAAGRSPEEATVTAMDTAGRAVVFAGLAVIISLLGMLLMGLAFITGLAIGAAVTVAVTMIASVSLLPALLGFARERVEVTRWRALIAASRFQLRRRGASHHRPPPDAEHGGRIPGPSRGCQLLRHQRSGAARRSSFCLMRPSTPRCANRSLR